MIAGLATAVGNAALNTLFVFGFGMGLPGIALATVLSRLFGLVWATRRALAHERARRAAVWPPVQLAHRLRPAPAILLLGIPSASTHLLTSVEGLLINRVLTEQPDSTTVIAAYGIYHQMLTLTLMPTIGTSLAVLPFVARALPEGLHEHARGELRRIFGLLAAASLLLTILLGWIAGRPIARLLVPQEAADPAAIEELAVAAFRLLPLGSLAAFPFLLLRPVFEASGHPRRGIGIATLRFVLVCTGVLAGVTLGPRFGTSGLVGTIAGVVAGTAAASAITRGLAYRLLR
jgi:Na+-driven multidrug efflux pump